MAEKLKLYGFNNLSKTLGMNIYYIRYVSKEEKIMEYLQQINQKYNQDELEKLLNKTAEKLDAHILHISKQDYEPYGASAAMMIAEEPVKKKDILYHLDKSHLTVHTYPETYKGNPVFSFRLDMEVSTCGLLNPLYVLNDLFRFFMADIYLLDYRVRGFTRDIKGKKHFIDHKKHYLNNFIEEDFMKQYKIKEADLEKYHVYHCRMRKKKIDDLLILSQKEKVSKKERQNAKRMLQKEIDEIFQEKCEKGKR